MDQEALRSWPFAGTFEGLVGTVYDWYESGEITGHFNLRPDLLAPSGDAPLGLYATVAEGAASVGAGIDARHHGMTPSGLSNDTTVTQRFSNGRVNFRAKCQHDASDLSIWTIEFRDVDDATVAVSTVRVAIRPSFGG